MTLQIEPTTFLQGRYEVIEVLGRGQYSSVYKVYDNDTDTQYALKMLNLSGHDKDIAEAMFNKEVDALTGLKHEGVVQLVHHFPEPRHDRLCIVLELIPRAKTLEQFIREVQQEVSDPLPLSWRLEKLQSLIDVLDLAHNRHVIHRDVKPGNLLLGQRAGKTIMKLADFGIARVMEHYGRNKTLTLKQFHTIPYAPPEQLLANETTMASDYYAYGVVLAGLLTWQLPSEQLSHERLEAFLAPLGKVLPNTETTHMTRELIYGLLHENPLERPRPATIRRVLQSLLNRIVTKPQVGLKVTQNARDKIENFGMSTLRFFEDLNDFTVAEYQENIHIDTKKVNVVFYGRSVMAFTVADYKDPEHLVMVDAHLDQPDLHRKKRESDTVHVCAYELYDGYDSAYNLLNEFYEYYVRNRVNQQRYEAKEDLLEASLFILDRLENQATELTLSYRQRDKQSYDDILTVEVISATTSADDGLKEIVAFNDEVISEWIDGLDESVVFSLERSSGKAAIPLGLLRSYNRYTRELSLSLTYQGQIAPQGRIICSNVAQLASNRRQRIAVDRFLADDCVNPRLANLLLRPAENTLAERKPRELIQSLEPKQQSQSIVERALAAQDFFLIQGPPGTGKTTLISEIVLQILRDTPNARILLTAQANPAVDNAMDRLRELAAKEMLDIRTLRLTRSESGRGFGEFEDSFKAWIEETKESARVGFEALLPKLKPEQIEPVRAALTNWDNKLHWANDVRTDYAQAVHIYGVTCLRAPTLWELLRKVEFDWVIVDEAAKATDTEVLVPLVHGKRFILVGDQRQLPPYVDTEIEREMAYHGISKEEAHTSLFEKVFDLLPANNKTTLRRQYRMHRSIGDFVGKLFYNDIGGLETGVPDEQRDIAIDLLRHYEHRVLWFDVATGEEEKERDGTSFFNRSEAVKIDVILDLFNSNLKTKGITYSVGVITPYAAQVDLLLQTIVPSSKLWTNLKIEVSTVDAFQGRENDLTVYSLVRTEPRSLRFVSDDKRLNVSFSRARRALLIFGHRKSAETSNQFARALKLIPDKNIIAGGD